MIIPFLDPNIVLVLQIMNISNFACKNEESRTEIRGFQCFLKRYYDVIRRPKSWQHFLKVTTTFWHLVRAKTRNQRDFTAMTTHPLPSSATKGRRYAHHCLGEEESRRIWVRRVLFFALEVVVSLVDYSFSGISQKICEDPSSTSTFLRRVVLQRTERELESARVSEATL